MKKLIILFIFLLIAGGVLFYFGWVQIQIPPGEYGVVVTKTGGYDKNVIEPGQFVWRWERLIPTNFTLYSFSLTPKIIDVSITGKLPSGETYAENFNNAIDFSYNVRLSVSYHINSEQLPQLVAEEGLRRDTVDSWYKKVETHISTLVSTFFKNKAATSSMMSVENFTFKGFEEELLSILERDSPHLEFNSVFLERFQTPDFELYQRVRRNFYDVLDVRRQVLVNEIRSSAQAKAEDLKRIELLREYGKLLSEYPILLKYLALEKEQIDLSADMIPEILNED